MIKLKCVNENCGYSYEVSENEIKEYGQYHTKCLICGSKLKVTNLEEIVEKDLYTQVKENIDKWFKSDGIEATIELIERTKNTLMDKVYELYKTELEKRGFKLK